MRTWLLAVVALASGCSLIVPNPSDYTPDLEEDAGQTERDAGRDAATDSGTDSGPLCEDALTDCDGECVDTQASLEHCGACGNACAATDVCRAGECFDPVLEVAAAWYHTCARRASGRVFCWGDNTNGQLGDGSVLSSTTPVEVVGVDDAISIATGSALPGSGYPGTSCAVRRSGELWCWGSNHRGQLNDGTMVAQRAPVQALGIDTAVTVGNSFWGACVTRAVAEYVVCWDASMTAPVPDGVLGFSAGRVEQIAMSQSHACGREGSGRIACWGDNSWGQLGDGSTDSHAAARTVMEGASALAVGLGTSCAIDASGLVLCWGRQGDLSDPTPVVDPTPIGVDGAVALAGGSVALAHCAIIGAERSVVCWGLDIPEFARTSTERYSVAPTAIEGLTDVVMASVGIRHACAVRNDGSVWCWGYNAYGQLGDGSMTNRVMPTEVLLP